jgi:hypothetical protein
MARIRVLVDGFDCRVSMSWTSAARPHRRFLSSTSQSSVSTTAPRLGEGFFRWRMLAAWHSVHCHKWCMTVGRPAAPLAGQPRKRKTNDSHSKATSYRLWKQERNLSVQVPQKTCNVMLSSPMLFPSNLFLSACLSPSLESKKIPKNYFVSERIIIINLH